jgi:uncharacterized protein (DUF2235 family)
MAKNILIFADGTGNEGGLLPDASCTNVYSLYRATRVGPDSPIDPRKQLAFYVPGIGTPLPGQQQTLGRRLDQTIEQMFGNGLTKRIVACYVAVLSVWRPGDRLYLFGFSRGAYTVRCLAHVLELIGIPTKSNGSAISLDPVQLQKLSRTAVDILYSWGLPAKDTQKRDREAKSFRDAHECLIGPETGAVPYFIGVWDTVAALGWAHLGPILEWFNLWPLNYDEHFPATVRFARHAMAIDEYRKDFVRVPWGGSGTVLRQDRSGEPEQFQQIWFSGNHADIGGSYPSNESRLSDIALQWMSDFIEHELPEEARVLVDRTVLKCWPSCTGMMHDECMVGIGGTVYRWNQTDRLVPTDARLHETVYERLKLPEVRNFIGYGPYRPASLRYHEKAKGFYKGLPVIASGNSPS